MSEARAIAVVAPCGCLYRWHPDGYWYCALASARGGAHDASFFRALKANPGLAYGLTVAGMAMAAMGVGS